MATAKQIAANRRNAQRSTGPRTATGKNISSRNALRHGLSLPQEIDATALAAIDELATEIASYVEHNHKLRVTEAAAAVLEVVRVQKVRTAMLINMDLATTTPGDLQRLIALDRYEGRARTRRRRAAFQLENC
jgi:hypothetical protein